MHSGSAIKAPRSPILLAKVMVIRNEVLRGWKREQFAIGSNGDFLNALRTRLRSHGGAGSLTGGNRLKRPLRNLIMIGWVKIESPSVGERKAATAAR